MGRVRRSRVGAWPHARVNVPPLLSFLKRRLKSSTGNSVALTSKDLEFIVCHVCKAQIGSIGGK